VNTARSADPLDVIQPGVRIGKYEIVRRIAFGGMAEIYLARVSGIQGFQKYVVLKRILPQFAAREDFVQMFLREARLAATLDHAHIAHVHDIGEIGGSYFYTMEYLHGEDLRTIMRGLADRGERMPLEHAIGIVLGAASGLHYAHEKKGPDGHSLGIVHRDVSPSNIVVTFDGGVKLVDFGVAKMTAGPDLSRGDSVKGKLAYMSPEQVQAQRVDRRSDIFALGIVLYEITTHQRLFAATTEVDVMRMVLQGTIKPPSVHEPRYPADLEAIVMQALEKDPNRRYPSARELQRDLEAFTRLQRIQVSSAALAEWMERTFGPKREAWHDLPPPALAVTRPPPVPEAADATIIDGATAATRPVVHEDVVTLPVMVLDTGDFTFADSVARPAIAPAPPPARRTRHLLVAGAGLLALALVAVGAVGVSRARPAARAAADPDPVTSAAPTLTVVAESGSVAVEPGGAVPHAAAGAEAPSPAAAPVAVPARAARAAAASPRAARNRAAPNPDSFSSALARHEREIRTCLTQNAEQAATAGEISFRFDIRTDGHVAAAAVLPEALGATPLGACLRQIAAHTVFAPQPEPMTFRIPLSLRVQRSQNSGR
jgi:tRNA A-37 threonylcarbamoyl transferase component Bud32